MFSIIDDDEWLDLSVALSDVMAELPTGSRLIESLAMPPFRAAMRSSATQLPGVLTVPHLPGQIEAGDAVRKAIRLAVPSHRRPTSSVGSPGRRGPVTIAVTQTDDAESIAVVVTGLPGERYSFRTFDPRPGSLNIDIGLEVVERLRGWVVRSPQRRLGLTADAA